MSIPQTTPRGPQLPQKGLGLAQDVIQNLKLFWRLFKDPQVSIWLKIVWAAASLWFFLPFLPDLMPGLPFDDFAAPVVFAYIFNALCPPWLVAEHKKELEREAKGERVVRPQKPVQDKAAKRAEPSVESKTAVGKSTGRYYSHDKGYGSFDEVSADIMWEEYEHIDPRTKKKRPKWRRYVKP